MRINEQTALKLEGEDADTFKSECTKLQNIKFPDGIFSELKQMT